MPRKYVRAGLLLFRRRGGRFDVLPARPGGPFWTNRDARAWFDPVTAKPKIDPAQAERTDRPHAALR